MQVKEVHLEKSEKTRKKKRKITPKDQKFAITGTDEEKSEFQ